MKPRAPQDTYLLVVDDELALRDSLAYEFRRKGFNVFTAAGGREAFAIVQSNPIHVVLTDIRMPDGDGVELLKRIKELDPSLPAVMFISGFTELSLEEAFHLGVDAVFSKPFDRKQVVAAVMRAISSKDELWARKDERIEVAFEIELRIEDLGKAIRARVLNLGRGGIYVGMNDPFPAIDSRLSFRISVAQSPPPSIDGEGVVRWVRPLPAPELPAGCGIEFTRLSDECRRQVIELIEAGRTKSYIPKS
jgi:CheY-like chemotaxis protein/Tfp pilus assembly protein PilZ